MNSNPLTLDEARAAILSATYRAGLEAVSAAIDPFTTPPGLDAETTATDWRARTSAERTAWMRVARNAADASRSASLCTPAALAWFYWAAFRHAPPTVAPVPLRADLAHAEVEIDRTEAREEWQQFATRAARAFAEITRPTGGATFTSHRGASER